MSRTLKCEPVGMAILTSMMEKAKKRGLPEESIHRLATPEGDALLDKMVAMLAEATAAVSNMITRTVYVDRTRSPQEALNATGRTQYVNYNVVQTMPKGKGEKTEVVFLKPGRQMTDDELEQWFDERGYKLADPYSLARVNEDDPSFADSHPNATHWKDSDGRWCYTAFYRWRGSERAVDVDRNARDWGVGWWFGGVRK